MCIGGVFGHVFELHLIGTSRVLGYRHAVHHCIRVRAAGAGRILLIAGWGVTIQCCDVTVGRLFGRMRWVRVRVILILLADVTALGVCVVIVQVGQARGFAEGIVIQLGHVGPAFVLALILGPSAAGDQIITTASWHLTTRV